MSSKKLCPCGSGRKSRYCCDQEKTAEVSDDLKVQRIRKLSRDLSTKVSPAVKALASPDDWHCAVEDFRPTGVLEDADFPLFIPWMFYLWRKEDSAQPKLCERFLVRYRSSLSPMEKELVQQIAQTSLDFYQVVERLPGSRTKILSLTDPSLEIIVYDIQFSESAVVGHIFFGQVVVFQGVGTIEAIASLQIPARLRHEVLRFADWYQENVLADPSISFEDAHYELLDFYWELEERMKAPPRLQNTSGDELCFHKIVYEHSSQKETIKALADLTTVKKWVKEIREAAENERYDEDGTLTFPWQSKSINPKLGAKTSYGQITVGPRQLTVTTNSNKRAEKIKKEIEKRLGQSVTFKADMIEDVSQVLARPPEPKSLPSPSPTLEELPADVQKSILAMAAERKKAWFDQRIPALNNMTPREAIKTSQGKKLLEDLICHYEDSRTKRDSLTQLMNLTRAEIRAELGF